MFRTVRSILVFSLLALLALALATVFPGRATSAVYLLKSSNPTAMGFWFWNDTYDEDGTHDAGEPLLTGGCVRLYTTYIPTDPDNPENNPEDQFWFNWADDADEDGFWYIWADDADEDGWIWFYDLPASDYFLKIDPCGVFADAGYESIPLGGPNEPNDSYVNPVTGKTGIVTVVPEQVLILAGGMYIPGTSIGDRVWKDLNANGIQDPGETGLSGVTVELYTPSNLIPVATTTTGPTGLYVFVLEDLLLALGNYYVKFIFPSVYFTLQDEGTDDALDSDADPSTGETHVITLGTSDEDNLTLDAGVIPIAITCGGDLMISGNPEIQGAFGSVHANGDLTISGNPMIAHNATASGIYSVSGNPLIGGIAAGGVPEVPIPPVNPAEYKAIADYELWDDGSVYDSDGVYLGYYGSNSFNGWKWGGDKWDFSSDGKFDGTYYIEGNAVVSGNPGSPEDPWKITIIATRSIEISGGPTMQANSSDILLLAGGDLKISGNPDQYFIGNLLAHEQISISGNPTLQGAITVEDAENISGLVDENEISGEIILIYPAP